MAGAGTPGAGGASLSSLARVSHDCMHGICDLPLRCCGSRRDQRGNLAVRWRSGL